ncbi:MAG TPA: SGNH/GDSL hydrolase family protein [Methylocystis sp.]|nr:SGNH/GDSL hydrolase family protein [Methylocystis sp.]
MLQGLRLLSLTLAVLAAALLLGLKRSDEPRLDCARVAGDAPYRLLIVGESWAAGGKFFPELPQTVSQRLQGRGVEACSLGFSGRNTRLLYYELRTKFPKEKLYDLFGGERPDKVILMTGVNDEIQHVGAPAYVEYNKKLTEYFSDADDVELISVPRVNERHFKSPNLFSYFKRFIMRCLYNGCEFETNEVYRVALWRDHPELHIIEYDDFIERYEGHEQCYTPDGVHLTDEWLHKYGTFIGNATALRSAGIQKRSATDPASSMTRPL